MNPTDTTRPLFQTRTHLHRLRAFWEAAAEDERVPGHPLARFVLHEADRVPALFEEALDASAGSAHRAALELLLGAVLPPARSGETPLAVLPPLAASPLYATPPFEALALDLAPETPAHTWLQLALYREIAHRLYEVELPRDHPFVHTTTTPDGLARYHRFHLDLAFADVQPLEAMPALDAASRRRLLTDSLNLNLWQELLPPDRFTVEGVFVLSAVDVTDQEVLSALKHDLLQPHALTTEAHLDGVQRHLRTLLHRPDLDLGLLALRRGDEVGMGQARPLGRSLLIGQDARPTCSTIGDSVYGEVLHAEAPVVVSDLAACSYCTPFERHLMGQGYQSLLLAPLRVEDGLVGVLELGSPDPCVINAINASRLSEVIELFATATRRSLAEQEDHVQAVIKRQYTAVHPVVEWRFREAALAAIEQRGTEALPQPEPIVFDEVYPLYGLSDIRDSSDHRNAAIQADLAEQLALALEVMLAAGTYRALPVLDERAFRIRTYMAEVRNGFSSEHELVVLDFLAEDIEPLFEHLAGFGPGVREAIARYRDALDPDLGILHRRRKAYEASVTRINDTIGGYLDEQEVNLQTMSPHYFEKYKTDGVEHTMYVGASLLERDTFDPLYLQNLRLAQLRMMAGVVWELERLKPSLPVPLETAHLVLAQHAPLAIRFRQDEKRFDVDGAYNVRYEIMKKRIDKARVRGTTERLTQPGHLAIVYAQTREAQEYRRYLEYLRAAGYVDGPVEELALEDMQGVSGLQALRVRVAEEPPYQHLGVRPEQESVSA